MITPAISVLCAVEGLEVATPRSRRCVVPSTVVILIGCSSFSATGPRGVGAAVRPDHGRLVRDDRRCSASAASSRDPRCCRARESAGRALSSSSHNGVARLPRPRRGRPRVTGGEALYADMGHFGARPIASRGTRSSCPRSCSTTSGRVRCCSRDPRPSSNPFYCSRRAGRCIRWSSSPPPRRSSRRRR